MMSYQIRKAPVKGKIPFYQHGQQRKATSSGSEDYQEERDIWVKSLQESPQRDQGAVK